ncbi:MAG: hypothetical protein NTW19_09785 [Planctomycetota bacterium]|nr:hypothetical protein [Planctomycetota bacterium]
MSEAGRETETPPPPETGRIDIHSHLLPGIDDGCADIEESFACVRRLIEAGYSGTVCTPHVWAEEMPENVPANIHRWTAELQQRLDAAGLKYRVWPGGELRLFEGVEDWIEEHGAPTLAGSRCLLVDFWVDRWPSWVLPTFKAMIDRGYQPIMAHPERMKWNDELMDRLVAVSKMGVWLQCNANSVAGMEGPTALSVARSLLKVSGYHLAGLDMHRLKTLESRLEGLKKLQAEFGARTLDMLTIDAPRRLIFGGAR